MLKYALLLASISIGLVHGNQPCLGAPVDRPSFVPAPESCSAYTLCWLGQTFRNQSCPAGFLFDAISQECSSSTCNNCAPFGIQNLPYPQSCNQYIECNMGIRTFRVCPNGWNFDRRSGTCNWAQYVDCVDDPSYTTTTTQSPWPTTTTQAPWPPTATPTIWPPTTTPPGNELPWCQSDGILHPHPTSCSHFYICVNFQLWIQECPTGQHWNRRTEQCDTPWAAQCPIVGVTV